MGEQIKRLEKNLSVSKRSLTSATKSHEKLMKQFDKNSNSLLSLKSESSEFEEILKKNQSMEKDLNKEIISLEKELSNYINSSNEVSPNVQRVSQSVIDQQEDFKSKLTSEHRIMVREYAGTLICKERENEKSLKDLKDDIERLSKSLESNSTKLKVLMADLEKIDEDEDMNDGAFKIFNQVEEAKNSLTSLERHLKERREEGTKLESQLENLKQYDSPNPAGRFFKTPRTQALPSYKSPIIPSPRKKMATGDVKTPPSTPRRSSLVSVASTSGRSAPVTPMRSFLEPPRVSPRKTNRFRLSSSSIRSSGDKASKNALDIMSMSESSQ